MLGIDVMLELESRRERCVRGRKARYPVRGEFEGEEVVEREGDEESRKEGENV
jgi:hypothetical protein